MLRGEGASEAGIGARGCVGFSQAPVLSAKERKCLELGLKAEI